MMWSVTTDVSAVLAQLVECKALNMIDTTDVSAVLAQLVECKALNMIDVATMGFTYKLRS